MYTSINLISILLTSTQFSSVFGNTDSSKDYFTTFSKSLDQLRSEVQSPSGIITKRNEISNLVAGTEREGKLYVRFAGASYCDKERREQWNCVHCKHIPDNIEFIQNFQNESTETSGYIALNKDKKEVVISFRGSSNTQNWLLNSKTGKTQIRFGRDVYNVHRGFKEIIDNLYPQIAPIISAQLKANPTYKLLVTGHSLGGAISVLTALRYKYDYKLNDNRIKLYTYGAPRVGDANFARFLNKHSFVSGRFVNENDTVPHLPAENSEYNHSHNELWVNGMKTKLCNPNYLEDPDCSYKTWYATSSKAHLKIWDVALGNDSC